MELVESASIYAKDFYEDIGILMELRRRITRQQIFGEGRKDAALSHVNE